MKNIRGQLSGLSVCPETALSPSRKCPRDHLPLLSLVSPYLHVCHRAYYALATPQSMPNINACMVKAGYRGRIEDKLTQIAFILFHSIRPNPAMFLLSSFVGTLRVSLALALSLSPILSD